MGKGSSTVWECQNCGSQFPKWTGQCPDVRYHHPLDAKAQEELTMEFREMLAVVAITDFGGGADPIALRKALPENKRAVFLYQPHAKCISPDGEIVEGCGAQNAKSALNELPPSLAKAIYGTVLGKTTPEHAGFLAKSLGKLESGEGVVAPFLHQDRAIAADLVDSKGDSRPLRLAKFLTSAAGEKFAKDFEGLPPEKLVQTHVGDGFKNVAVIDTSALVKLIR